MQDEETAAQEPEAEVPPSSEVAMASEISRRVSSILDAVEREASRLREDAQAEASRYSENARRHADDLVEERRRRIAELSDELVTKAEAVVARLDDAAPVRAGFENLVRALGDAAERLSKESEETAENFEPPLFHEGAKPAPPPPPPPAPPQPVASPYGQPGVPAPPAYYQQPGFEPQAQPHPARTPEPAWQPAPPQTQQLQPPPQPQPPQPPPEIRGRSARTTWRDLDDARMVAIQMASSGSTRGDVRGHLSRNLGIPDPERTLDEIFGAGTGDEARVPWTTGSH